MPRRNRNSRSSTPQEPHGNLRLLTIVTRDGNRPWIKAATEPRDQVRRAPRRPWTDPQAFA